MPIEPVTLDTSQRPTQLGEAESPLEYRIVEGVEAAVNQVQRQAPAEEVSAARSDEHLHSGLSAEFEAARLEAGTRLALSIERVEIERPEAIIRKFQQAMPVVIFGSLQLSVRV